MKLSNAQTRALTYLAKRKKGNWTNKTPVTQRCLNALSRKGLVIVAFDPKLGWCEKITSAGYEAIQKRLGSANG